MKKLQFALVGAAALGLAACGDRDADSMENIDANTPSQADQLNALADDAANRAEAEAMGTQAEQVQEAEDQANADTDDVEPTQNPDENVSGM
jgi:hypothetical protein